MIEESTKAELRSMLLDIGPELSGGPVYVIDQEDISDEIDFGGCLLGFAITGSRTVAFRDVLGKEWQGLGNAVVLNSAAIRDSARPGHFMRVLKNVAIHEGGHDLPLVPIPFETGYQPSEPFKRLVQHGIEAWKNAPAPEPGEDEAHDIKFVRRCVHLFYRAVIAGHDVAPDFLFGPYHWMANVGVYLTTLLEECDKMRNETFATIEATTPPAYFVEQWQGDLENYQRQQRLRNQQQCTNT